MDIPGYVPLVSMGPLDAASRFLAAFLLGGVVGWNRERIGKPAGLRTHIMVSLGACAFLTMGIELLANYSEAELDPTRVLQGVVGGIGFLGAGSIIQSRGTVEGTTTAATVWVAGAIGAGCGLGNYVLMAILVIFCFFTLGVLGRFDFRSAEAKKSK
jgi:putative Mg2+ transporter-C (MgtC) family protein